LAIEFTADNQQFAFHAWKHAYLAQEKAKENGGKTKEVIKKYDAKEHWPGARLNWTPADAKRGFVTRGLWRYSRHPNFACEQAFWVCSNLPVSSLPNEIYCSG
jgi:steroid 5-alpha reductase family enzyme